TEATMAAERGELHRRELLTLALAGASTLVSGAHGNVLAADGERKMGRTTVTRLVENERVEVVRMTARPGDKGEMKQRPDRVVYIIRGAKVRFRYPDGKTEDAVWKTGDVVYQKADNRQVENVDTDDLEYISVHFK
ncbi:MAG TPA: hypothetical protein VI390_02430, partial [Methyloceanibacter sp.]